MNHAHLSLEQGVQSIDEQIKAFITIFLLQHTIGIKVPYLPWDRYVFPNRTPGDACIIADECVDGIRKGREEMLKALGKNKAAHISIDTSKELILEAASKWQPHYPMGIIEVNFIEAMTGSVAAKGLKKKVAESLPQPGAPAPQKVDEYLKEVKALKSTGWVFLKSPFRDF